MISSGTVETVNDFLSYIVRDTANWQLKAHPRVHGFADRETTLGLQSHLSSGMNMMNTA
jgi:hypothetical protein